MGVNYLSAPHLKPAVVLVHLDKKELVVRLVCLITDLAPVVPIVDAHALDLAHLNLGVLVDVADHADFGLMGSEYVVEAIILLLDDSLLKDLKLLGRVVEDIVQSLVQALNALREPVLT